MDSTKALKRVNLLAMKLGLSCKYEGCDQKITHCGYCQHHYDKVNRSKSEESVIYVRDLILYSRLLTTEILRLTEEIELLKIQEYLLRCAPEQSGVE